MSVKLQAIRGMNDILPAEIDYWHFLEAEIRDLMRRYGYQEIRVPVLEKTELFKRSVGMVTDIVEKEMYTFIDRDKESLSLRPECTAGCVRAGIEHGLFYHQIQRLWYLGPIFRHERPQRGRYRQFYQFGAEVYGLAGPLCDAEIILLNARLWQELGITDQIRLQINSLGTKEDRTRYREALIEYFTSHHDALDEDSKRRLHTNPMRILDSKNPALKNIIHTAPQLITYLNDESLQNYALLKEILTANGLDYEENPYLVRGLDYYTDTVFEWITDSLGAQGTVSAGGRYDNLVEDLGGDEPTKAVGFALGCERVIEILKTTKPHYEVGKPPQVYLITVGAQAQKHGFILAERLRSSLPKLSLQMDLQGGSFKNQFKRADKCQAHFALILGEDEVKQATVGIKFLREGGSQLNIPQIELVEFLSKRL